LRGGRVYGHRSPPTTSLSAPARGIAS